MNETFDPRDRNHDGKVSIGEKLLDAADKANEAIYESVDAIKAGAGQAVNKAKETLESEEVKAKTEQIKVKAKEAADKVVEAAKDVIDDVKEGAGKLRAKKAEKPEAPAE